MCFCLLGEREPVGAAVVLCGIIHGRAGEGDEQVDAFWSVLFGGAVWGEREGKHWCCVVCGVFVVIGGEDFLGSFDKQPTSRHENPLKGIEGYLTHETRRRERWGVSNGPPKWKSEDSSGGHQADPADEKASPLGTK